jgi:signal transduction histidine kinase
MSARVQIPPLAAVAHELRTPLHGVLGCAALLADTRLDAEQRAHLAALTEAARAALALADDAIALARLGAGPMDGDGALPVRPAACDLRPVLAGVARTLAPLAAARGLAFDWTADADAPATAWADPARVREVLLNLGANAVRATRRGRVQLRLRRAGGGVAVDVVDTGPGLTPAARARLFRAWTSDADGGAGLGLVLARALAERMGGDITVESVHGAGSTFTLALPVPHAPGAGRGALCGGRDSTAPGTPPTLAAGGSRRAARPAPRRP